MLKNYVKIALRNMWRNRLFSVINIVGLSLSMTIGLGLLTGIKHNFDTDHFHPHIERTVRILTTSQIAHHTSVWATVPIPVIDQLRQFSSIETVVPVRHGGQMKVRVGEGEVPVEVIFTEPDFFSVFGFRVESGDPAQLLKGPQTVLVSRQVAGKLFGGQQPIGQSVTVDGLGTFNVAGIIQKPEHLTHLPVEMVFPLQTAVIAERKGLLKGLSDQWDEYKTVAVYARLRSSGQLTSVNKSLVRLSHPAGDVANPAFLTFSAQLIEDITPWNPSIQNDWHAGMNWKGIWTYLLLAIALTLLAAFNYTSLSLARSLTRAREVGIRKASGAGKGQIFRQFITESTSVAVISFVFSILISFVADGSGWLPDNFRPAPHDLVLLMCLLLYTLVTGIVAGLIPAWFLSAFQPAQVLRSLQAIRLFRGVGVYKGLLVIQFAVTTMLMVFVVILRDAGANTQDILNRVLPDNVVILSLKDERADRLLQSLQELSQVRRVSATNLLGIYPAVEPCTIRVARQPEPLIVQAAAIDANWPAVFGQKLKAGSNFPPDLLPGQEPFVLINEAMAALLNRITRHSSVLGQRIQVDSSDVQIIGVLADQPNLSGESRPAVFRYQPNLATLLAVETEPGSQTTVINACTQLWQRHFPARIPDISIYKAHIQNEYKQELKGVNAVFSLFCGLVMLIACLGILGISAYSMEVRKRETGIRRTLGAGSVQLIWTLSRSFGKLLLWAGVLGVPAGWFCGSLLYERLGQSVDTGFVNLSVGFGLVIVVALMTVFSQTIRAIRVNPVHVLKGE